MIYNALNDDDHPLLDPNAAIRLEGLRIHYVGIGGSGMSGLAQLTHKRGAHCSGSDVAASPLIQRLEQSGIQVILKQTAESVPEDAQLIVASAAIRADHPELTVARQRKIPVLKYAQMLGRLMIHRIGVAIAGTHGKSTTTSMLSWILTRCDADPSFIIGATCDQLGGGVRVGQSEMLLAEACEYDRSFHNFHPKHAVILNCEEDHLDIYENFDAIVESFNIFAQKISPDGSLLIGHTAARRSSITQGLECDIQTIGYNPEADWMIQTSRPGPHGQTVALHDNDGEVARFNVTIPGEHMAYNAAVAAVTAHRLGIPWSEVATAIAEFKGLNRRMQPLGDINGVTVIDDYGHHPTEVETTLRALRRFYRPEVNGGRLICVFQPHQHSRTRFLLDQFAESFRHADLVIVPPIYFVRDSEQDRRAVSAADLVLKLQARDVEACHIAEFEDIVTHLKLITKPNDLVVVMGAGPVWKIGHQFAGLI